MSPLFIYFGRICELKFWILKCCADGKILWYSFLKIKLVLGYVPTLFSINFYRLLQVFYRPGGRSPMEGDVFWAKTFSDCNRKKIIEIKGRGRKFALF